MPVRVANTEPFVIRSLWRDIDSGKVYRVAYSGNGQSRTYLFPLTGRFEFVQIDTATLRAFANPKYRGKGCFVEVLDDPYSFDKLVERDLAGHASQSCKNWERIKDLVQPRGSDADLRFRRFLRRDARGRLVKEAADLAGVQKSIIYRDLARYFREGMTQFAVSSDYPECGRRRDHGKYRSMSSRERGERAAPRRYSKMPGARPRNDVRPRMLPSPERTRLMWQGVDLYFTNKQSDWVKFLGTALKKRKSPAQADKREIQISRLKQAVQPKRRTKSPSGQIQGPRERVSIRNVTDMLAHRSRAIVDVRDKQGYMVRLELKDNEVITPRQFDYFLKHEPAARLALEGLRAHEQKRSLDLFRGHATEHVKGPGDVFLMDATMADIYLVSRLHRSVVVGRPIVYFVVDLFSRMIVGFSIGLESASYEAAALALRSVVTPKPELCERYGFLIVDEDWPCRDMSHTFYLDRGSELMAIEPWKRLGKLGISVANSRPYTPTWRAVVERRFGCLNVIWQPHTRGIVERDFNERGVRRYQWDAVHTLSEFTLIILRAIQLYHRTSIMDDLPDPDFVYDSYANTPLNRWNWGIKERSGLLFRHNPREIQIATWQREKATATKGGIHWNKAYFSGSGAQEAYIRSLRGTSEVDILADPGDLSEILLKVGDVYVPCAWSPTNRVTKPNISIAEWTHYCGTVSKNNARETSATQAERIKHMHNSRLDSYLAEADQRVELEAMGLRHPMDKDMKEARKHEREVGAMLRRPDTSTFGPSCASLSEPSVAQTDEEDTEDIEHALEKARTGAHSRKP